LSTSQHVYTGVSVLIVDLPGATALRTIGDAIRFFNARSLPENLADLPANASLPQHDVTAVEVYDAIARRDWSLVVFGGRAPIAITDYFSRSSAANNDSGNDNLIDLSTFHLRQSYNNNLKYLIIFVRKMLKADNDLFTKTWRYGKCQVCEHVTINYPGTNQQHRCAAGGVRKVYNTIRLIRGLEDLPVRYAMDYLGTIETLAQSYLFLLPNIGTRCANDLARLSEKPLATRYPGMVA
jgi:hypothetical protein